jgi:hypothetical protein
MALFNWLLSLEATTKKYDLAAGYGIKHWASPPGERIERSGEGQKIGKKRVD